MASASVAARHENIGMALKKAAAAAARGSGGVAGKSAYHDGGNINGNEETA